MERAKALTAEHPKATGYFEVSSAFLKSRIPRSVFGRYALIAASTLGCKVSAKSGQGVTEAFDHAVFLARPNEFDPAIASSVGRAQRYHAFAL